MGVEREMWWGVNNHSFWERLLYHCVLQEVYTRVTNKMGYIYIYNYNNMGYLLYNSWDMVWGYISDKKYKYICMSVCIYIIHLERIVLSQNIV